MRENGECQVETEREGSVGPQDQKASPELEVCTVCRATKAKEATKDLRDQRGQQVIRVWREMMVRLGCLECQVKWEQEGFPDQEALLAFLAHREFRERKEDPDLKEMRDLSGPLGQRE